MKKKIAVTVLLLGIISVFSFGGCIEAASGICFYVDPMNPFRTHYYSGDRVSFGLYDESTEEYLNVKVQSSDAKIAKYDADEGELVLLKPGKATLSAKYKNKTYKYTVSVSESTPGWTDGPSSGQKTIYVVEGNYVYLRLVEGLGKQSAIDSYTVGDSGVVSAERDYNRTILITGEKKGKTTITGVSKKTGKKYQATIQVIDPVKVTLKNITVKVQKKAFSASFSVKNAGKQTMEIEKEGWIVLGQDNNAIFSENHGGPVVRLKKIIR